MSEKKHDVGMSVAKGLCIILMVVAHSGSPACFDRAISLFHMPCFFLISGYFLTDAHIDNYKKSLLRKVKSLWWYFVKWTVIFVLLHNVLHMFYIYSEPLTLAEMAKKSLVSVFMWNSESLLGGYWFLKDLFQASVIIILLLKLIRWRKPDFSIARYGWIIVIPFIIYAAFIDMLHFHPTFKVTALATAFFMTGVWLRARFGKEFLSHTPHRLKIGIAMMLALIFLSIWYARWMGNVTGFDLMFYYVVAMWGSISLILISKAIASQRVGTLMLDFIGTETITILTFHFLSFKAVSYLKVYMHDLPMESVSEFPVIMADNQYFWILYTAVGIGLPLAVKYLFDRIRVKDTLTTLLSLYPGRK